ncbi:MgtC/SapB family protein [Chitinophaga lutea]|uniref:MgtC/SapB family protein n=1 Tax=Chitinophaga lutea TaxID=2488634 RepID=A0A3N4PXT1_9BACT|nr:MgtC/SapB family protein [Chitinophaga lutea]RPE08897.1 MgtC/SapB family protein [Chitinophaga lutea]
MYEYLNGILGPFLLGILVSAGIGLILGLEREFDTTTGNEHFAGLRTFALCTLLGYIVAYLSISHQPWIFALSLPGIFILLTFFHFAKTKKDNLGIGTELALLIAYCLGGLVALHFIREALAAAVITITVLSLRQQFRKIVSRITQEELYAFVKFIILSLLILPFLPDKDFGPGGVINPQTIGLVVVITSSLSFVGYFLIKFGHPEKGILLTAFLGGTFSSTAVTWLFSSKSRESPALSDSYAAGIILAGCVMFMRVLLVTYLFNSNIFMVLLIPCLLLTSVGLLWVFFITRKVRQKTVSPPLQLGNPVNILNAMFFGALFTGISLLVFYADKFFGTSGLYVSGILSGISDVDAISISMARYAREAEQLPVAVIVIVLAMISNTVVKAAIAITKGAAAIRKTVAFAFGSMVLAGLVYVLTAYWLL